MSAARMPDVAAVRERLKAIEPRARLSAAIAHVTGAGSRTYGPMIRLFNLLEHYPQDAGLTGRYHAEDWPAGTARQADDVGMILAALEGLEHEATTSHLEAARRYVAAVRETLAAREGS